MIKTTLRFLRHGALPDVDDVITIYTVPTSTELFRVLYAPGDSGSRAHYECQMTRSGVLEYVSDILKSMRYDVDPFDRIQISTDLHPTVMYSVADMDNSLVRKNLENMVYTSLRVRVARTVA